MDLSVIIVNYNVRYFLEQCLHSVQNAARNLDVEMIVVDNNSVDGSSAMVKEKFPDVLLIENKNNQGFSKANNQGIRKASSPLILLLNPDTVIEEDTLDKCVAFMLDHPDAGSLGVKMIDGSGRFLPESKRALPTPMIAFYKIFGLSSLFPRSKVFGRYHLSYLNKDETHVVDVLPGAFMMLRKTALDKTGLLDESFFMYGEDIDLSYRLSKAGYKNYYFPEATIIHYKGESTKKGSLNYVVTFYKAMIIFARKHFTSKMARSYSFLINLAIYFRALMAISRRTVKNIILPLLDALLLYTGFFLIKPFWEQYRFGEENYYPPEFMYYVVPAYIIIWLISLFFAGGYDKPVKLFNVVKGITSGTFIILVIYALLPESLRYSRAMLLLGAGWSMLTSIALRITLNFLRIPGFQLDARQKKRILIIGKEKESQRVKKLLQQTDKKPEIVGMVSPDTRDGDAFLGTFNQLEDIIRLNRVNELIFCARDISSRKIIQKMIMLEDTKLEYKIAPPETLTIIGSNSINTPGDLYLIDVNALNKPFNKRNKRLLDVLASLLLLLFYPLLALAVPRPGTFFVNIFRVLSGQYAWVGYLPGYTQKMQELPRVRKGILTPAEGISDQQDAGSIRDRVNISYARDYSIFKDLIIMLRGWKKLGRAPVELYMN